MRRCEKCNGPGPCLWNEPCARYLCAQCHSTPLDPFFLRPEAAVATNEETYRAARDAWKAHAPACSAGGCGTPAEKCEPRRRLFDAYMGALSALWAVRS